MVKHTAMITEPIHAIFDTDAGWIGITASAMGLLRTTLPQPSAAEARRILGTEDATPSPHLLKDLISRFRAYFSGHEVSFTDRLDLSPATAFQRQVWEATRLITYGNTRSYRWVAEKTGKPGAARAVGQALAKNPLPIIVPCHRVIASNGKLGGFSGGAATKRHLLQLEATNSKR